MNEEPLNDTQEHVSVFIDAISRLRQKVIQLEKDLEEAHHAAHHDELTGLPNRNLLRDRLNQAIVHAARQKKQVGLLLLDLDGFKAINDRFGHVAGDNLLKQVSMRLLSSTREEDTVGRFGGDEFVILLPEVEEKHGVTEVSLKLGAKLAMPYLVNNHLVTISASIGIAVYPADGDSQTDLIRRADIAMYLAKTSNTAPLQTR